MTHRFPRPSARPWLACLLAGLALLALIGSGGAPVAHAAPSQQSNSDWYTFANGDNIWSLAFEGPNTVWAGTRGGGVVRWDITDLNTPLPQQFLFPQTSLAGNVVRKVAVDQYNHKWFATDRGLTRLSASGAWLTFTRESTGGKLPSNVITALGRQGSNLWVGLQQVWNPDAAGVGQGKWEGGGFVRIDLSQEPPVVMESWNADSNPNEVASNNVTDIAVDSANGDVWITMRVDQQNVDPTPERPSQYFKGRAGGITVVHPQGNSFTFDKFQRGQSSTAWPKYDSILSVAIDSRGIKWFGSGDLDEGGNGFYALSGNSASNARWKWFSAGGAISGSIVVANMPVGADQIPRIAVSADDKLWISMANGATNVDQGEGMGVCRVVWDRNFDANTPPICEATYGTTQSSGSRLPGNLVRAIAFRPDRNLRLFGTAGRLPSKGSTDYAQGSDGHGIGVQILDNSGGAQVKTLVTGGLDLTPDSKGIAPSSNHISALSFDDAGQLWVGYAYPLANGAQASHGRGIDLLTSDGATFTWRHQRYSPNDDQISLAVSSLAYHPNTRQLWVGLLRDQLVNGTILSGGVAIRKPDGTWTLYRDDNGAPSSSVTSLAVDGPRVWAGTGTGWPSGHASVDIAKGVGIFDTSLNSWLASLKAPPLLNTEITEMAVGAGQVWVANTWPQSPGVTNPPGGLSAFNQAALVRNIPANTDNLTLASNDPRSVFYTADGTLWAGGYYTLLNEDPVLSDAVINWLKVGETTWDRRVFADDGWVSVIAGRNTTPPSVWIGTTRGGQNIEDFPSFVFPPNSGNRYIPKGGLKILAGDQWRELTPANSPLVSGHITALALDSAGALWIGTTMGLMRYTGNIDGTVVTPPTPIASATPVPTEPPTATPAVPATITPAGSGGGAAATFTPVVATPTPTPFPGSPPPEIPEASTLWLLGSGLAGLAGYLRFFARRRR
ncbi:MAG: hypothetical protein KIT87_17390 [Anaerolineae bacterium]|nr:hypothetical protein [Anaerolineae bacterium]